MPRYGVQAPISDREIHLLALEIACLRAKARFAEVEEAERDATWLIDRPDTTTISMLRVARDNYRRAIEHFDRAFAVIREGVTSAGLESVAALDDSDSSSDVPNK